MNHEEHKNHKDHKEHKEEREHEGHEGCDPTKRQSRRQEDMKQGEISLSSLAPLLARVYENGTGKLRTVLAMTFVSFVSFVSIVVTSGLQPPAGQSEFVPLADAKAVEQLPAAPLLITAYVFVWLAVFFYVWSIWRRLMKVEGEMDVLRRRSVQRSGTR